MPYATVFDVAALNTGRASGFTATSRPNASQVVGYLERIGGELDLILMGRGYSLPVPTTATQAWALLLDAEAKGANVMVQKASPNPSRADDADEMWQEAKAMIESVELGLAMDALTGDMTLHSVASPIFSVNTTEF